VCVRGQQVPGCSVGGRGGAEPRSLLRLPFPLRVKPRWGRCQPRRPCPGRRLWGVAGGRGSWKELSCRRPLSRFHKRANAAASLCGPASSAGGCRCDRLHVAGDRPVAAAAAAGASGGCRGSACKPQRCRALPSEPGESAALSHPPTPWPHPYGIEARLAAWSDRRQPAGDVTAAACTGMPSALHRCMLG